ncbi:hypothetical protein RIR_jg2784.t2 [Rhizophagus irregularis DAOM 181602=DAOM 197198]|nr:hypothetical protein RIR_jg2784.t2 [Rhizophagus irregularis DAOM 181602=DAOM 197198]
MIHIVIDLTHCEKKTFKKRNDFMNFFFVARTSESFLLKPYIVIFVCSPVLLRDYVFQYTKTKWSPDNNFESQNFRQFSYRQGFIRTVIVDRKNCVKTISNNLIRSQFYFNMIIKIDILVLERKVGNEIMFVLGNNTTLDTIEICLDEYFTRLSAIRQIGYYSSDRSLPSIIKNLRNPCKNFTGYSQMIVRKALAYYFWKYLVLEKRLVLVPDEYVKIYNFVRCYFGRKC